MFGSPLKNHDKVTCRINLGWLGQNCWPTGQKFDKITWTKNREFIIRISNDFFFMISIFSENLWKMFKTFREIDLMFDFITKYIFGH